ncbi:energy transducer TonB [Selenomonas ruminantium]|uniref:Protein TonB n=1 Tax=Selenomonas ruminantium TaxID=971 RepID=A0A1H0UJX8_SELRU|nr:energy transducer TonB [Selenomonas ruminantium]SDP66481.1 protein TonB [Selenomonas ruminantium]
MDYTLSVKKDLHQKRGHRLSWKLCLRPLPLSSICHVVGIGTVCLLLGTFYTADEPVRTTPEIAVEMISVSQVTGGGEAGGSPAAMPAIKNPMAAPMMHQRAITADEGLETAIAESPAAIPGTAAEGSFGESDGTGTAAGSGTAADAAGSGGTSAAGTGGIDSAGNAAAPAPAPTESMGSIAGRFAARVEANKEYPYMAIKRGETGVASVTVTLSEAGSLASVYVSGSSGSSLLDKAAMQAVRNSCPFTHGAARSITLTVPIHFDLQ